ncbi:hypothetical protein AMECASPLE_014468 [Ameca splendens]|uniref:Cilia- and flagella-associated protein 58 central coiled coil domain-containing protein n=1 Tax=Ameca splendens TaxID=208324 RepID=A0ABV1A0C8_9TELE
MVKYSSANSSEHSPPPWTNSPVPQQHQVNHPRLHITLPLQPPLHLTCCASSPGSSSTLHLESSRKQVEIDKKAKDELIRERDILHKNMIKAVQSAEKQQNLIKLFEQDKRTLEHEISGYRQEAQKQRKIIQQLEKERDRYINESSSLMQKVQQKITVVEDKEIEIFDWRKKATESECKLKQQENLLESIITERNLYSKNLIESQEEIAEIKRKIKIMNNQVSRLKDEIIGKEQVLIRDQQEQKRLEKDNEALKLTSAAISQPSSFPSLLRRRYAWLTELEMFVVKPREIPGGTSTFMKSSSSLSGLPSSRLRNLRVIADEGLQQTSEALIRAQDKQVSSQTSVGRLTVTGRRIPASPRPGFRGEQPYACRFCSKRLSDPQTPHQVPPRRTAMFLHHLQGLPADPQGSSVGTCWRTPWNSFIWRKEIL